MKERNETPFSMHKCKRLTTVRRQNGPTGGNRLGATQQDAADWLVRLQPVVLNPLQAFKHNSNCSRHTIFNNPGTGKALVMKARGWNVFSQYTVFDLCFMYWAERMPNSARLFKFLRSRHKQAFRSRVYWQHLIIDELASSRSRAVLCNSCAAEKRETYAFK